MTVSLDWLAQIDVTINTTVFQAPTFKNCMVMGVFPTADRPDGAGGYKTNWGTNLYHSYSNFADINQDFTVNYTAAITATQWAQAFKYQILIAAARKFFAQQPTPTTLIVGCIDNTSIVNYTTAITNITNQYNSFYTFYIADQVTATQVTQSNGIYDALNSLVASQNLKVCFIDTSDLNIGTGHFLYDATHDVSGGRIGNQRVMFFAHTLNAQTAVPIAALPEEPSVALSAAFMGAFYTNLFTGTVGLKSMSGQTLLSTAADVVIDKSALGTPEGFDGLIGACANVYPALGGDTGFMQYGLMTASTSTSLIYLDQVIGADYIKLNVQSDLASYILSQQPLGGVPYSDVGIQNLVTTFKNTLQRAVNQNVILPFSNADIVFKNYADVLPADKTNRIYRDLSANLTYLSRIQRVIVGITLGL